MKMIRILYSINSREFYSSSFRIVEGKSIVKFLVITIVSNYNFTELNLNYSSSITFWFSGFALKHFSSIFAIF